MGSKEPTPAPKSKRPKPPKAPPKSRRSLDMTYISLFCRGCNAPYNANYALVVRDMKLVKCPWCEPKAYEEMLSIQHDKEALKAYKNK